MVVHFDPSRGLLLACDASPYGVGAEPSQVMEDGMDHPVGFASITLTGVETRYSQLDRESLAVIFGVKHLHQYLYGRHFSIRTDHKPLLGLLNEFKPVPLMASPRVLR